jgi:hypothetical protein
MGMVIYHLLSSYVYKTYKIETFCRTGLHKQNMILHVFTGSGIRSEVVTEHGNTLRLYHADCISNSSRLSDASDS